MHCTVILLFTLPMDIHCSHGLSYSVSLIWVFKWGVLIWWNGTVEWNSGMAKWGLLQPIQLGYHFEWTLLNMLGVYKP